MGWICSLFSQCSLGTCSNRLVITFNISPNSNFNSVVLLIIECWIFFFNLTKTIMHNMFKKKKKKIECCIKGYLSISNNLFKLIIYFYFYFFVIEVCLSGTSNTIVTVDKNVLSAFLN